MLASRRILAFSPIVSRDATDHLHLGVDVDADLQIKDMETCSPTMAALLGQIGESAAAEIIEIVCRVPDLAAEQVVDRLAARLAGEIGESHVDAGKGEAGGRFAKLPEAPVP